jgi:hypothetical protein
MGGERTHRLPSQTEGAALRACENGCRICVPRWPSSCDRRGVVECWIGVGQEGGRRVVRLAGRFAEAQVPELMQVCAAGAPVCLDLTELVSTDAAGLEALSRVREQGALLTGAPTYIQLRLDSIARKSRSSRA